MPVVPSTFRRPPPRRHSPSCRHSSPCRRRQRESAISRLAPGAMPGASRRCCGGGVGDGVEAAAAVRCGGHAMARALLRLRLRRRLSGHADHDARRPLAPMCHARTLCVSAEGVPAKASGGVGDGATPRARACLRGAAPSSLTAGARPGHWPGGSAQPAALADRRRHVDLQAAEARTCGLLDGGRAAGGRAAASARPWRAVVRVALQPSSSLRM